MGVTSAADQPRHMAESGSLTREEFESRYLSCARTLWCIAAAVTGRREGAEDVVQEAAVVALGKLDEFEAGTSFEAWMSQIVRFVALNSRRRSIRSKVAAVPPAALDASGAFGGEGSPESGNGGGSTVADERLVEAMGELSETARACLLLRVVSGLSYREISRVLSVPEGTAMSHVHRSRMQLRQRLEGAR